MISFTHEYKASHKKISLEEAAEALTSGSGKQVYIKKKLDREWRKVCGNYDSRIQDILFAEYTLEEHLREFELGGMYPVRLKKSML